MVTAHAPMVIGNFGPGRHARFSREAAAGYKREIIEDANIIVVGAGALGQFLMLCLALIGYPRVTCVDMDHFEDSNVTRSPFYREAWAKAKAVAIGARSMCTARGEVVYRFAECMIQRLGDAVFRGPGRTTVLAAVDSQEARLWLAQRCRKLGVLLIEGGFYTERWNVSVFLNGGDDEPCWACGQGDLETTRLFSCDAYARQAERDGVIPATAPGAMGLGAAQVGILTQVLHGNLDLANSTISADLHRGFVQQMRRAIDPSCRVDHRVVAADAVSVQFGPEGVVATLLESVGKLVDDPIVGLPATFIRVAPCTNCRKPALVEKPEWALRGPLLCDGCGGPFPRTESVAEQHGTLSWPTSEAIYDTTLEDLGIGPGLHLDLQGQRDSLTVAIAGDVEPLLAVAEKEV